MVNTSNMETEHERQRAAADSPESTPGGRTHRHQSVHGALRDVRQLGHDKLHKAIERQAKDEMHHAEWLIRRIIFLEGTPVISKLNPIKIGQTVVDMVGNDQEAEVAAVRAYNQAIAMARDAGDQATADLLLQILKMEEGHADWAEMQRAQIEQMGSAELPDQSKRRRESSLKARWLTMHEVPVEHGLKRPS
jgi:bacterioferritin